MALAVVGLTAAPAVAAAQAKLELTPFFTSFYALANVDKGSGTHEVHNPAAGFGGRVTYWLTPTIGVEASGAYVGTGTRIVVDDTSLGVGGAAYEGNLTTFSGRVLYRPPRTNLYLFAGAGQIMRGGDTWDFFGFEELNDVAALAGFGVRASVTPKVSLLVSAELMFYQLDPDGDSGTFYDSTNQTDVYVTIGIPIGLMK